MDEQEKDVNADPRKLDWLEAQANEALRWRIEHYDLLRARAHELMKLALIGGSGAFAYSVSLMDKSCALAIVMGLVSLHLFGLAGMLMFGAMKGRNLPPIGASPERMCPELFNEPRTWNEQDISEIRWGQYQTIQKRIDLALKATGEAAHWHRRVRFVAVFLPAWVVVAVIVRLFFW